ncbi:MAG: type II secretion system protein GspM [Alphaproteobacteria bacterium]
MSGPRALFQRVAVLVLTVAVMTALVWFTVGRYLTALHDARTVNARLAQQIARLEASLSRPSSPKAPAPEDVALLMGAPGPGDDSAAGADLAIADLQARLRALVEDHGGRVEQLGAARSDEDTPFITVQIQFLASEGDAFALLSALETDRPVLAVEALDITALREGPEAGPTREVRLGLTVTAAMARQTGLERAAR